MHFTFYLPIKGHVEIAFYGLGTRAEYVSGADDAGTQRHSIHFSLSHALVFIRTGC